MARHKFRKPGAVAVGRLHPTNREVLGAPKSGVRRYILTAAQNNTMIHDKVWQNLQALARHYEARIMVSTFTYDQNSIGARSAKRGSEKEHREEYWWDERIEGYVCDRSVELAPGLIFCGELNILPTARNPIGGFEAYTGRASAILPHAKFQVTCVPSPKHRGTKFIYTTGTVTLRNYIQKKAGQVAQFHHGYGAALVEVDSGGTWFVRQLNADSDGTIHDLDVRVVGGEVTTGNRVEAIVWGDIHERQLESWVRNLCFDERASNPPCILDALRPRVQVMHDLLDFRSRNHHERDDPWKTFQKFIEKGLDVEAEVRDAALFLGQTARESCETVVACSNHDMALVRWLKETDWRKDPENARFHLKCNLAMLEAIARRANNFYAVEAAFALAAGDKFPSGVRFLRRDEEYVICPDAGGGIEVGMHGDKGANGAKGDLRAFARTGRKCIVGDRHTAGLYDGAMQVGVMGKLDMGYNEGMSSWSHTFAVVYPNGKRTLVTIYDKKWRAE